MRFKFANKIEQNNSNQSIGTVPVSALLGGDSSAHQVIVEKGEDYFYLFEYPSSTFQIVSADEGTTGGYIQPGPKLLHSGASFTTDILIGSPSSNLTATLSNAPTGDYKLYDLLTNKVFENYTISEPDTRTIYLGAEDYKEKVLVYRTESDQEHFVKASPRYLEDTDWSISNNEIHFINNDFITGEQVTIANNPLNEVEAIWTDREWFKSWEINIPRKVELGAAKTVQIKSNVNRHKYIQNEAIERIRPRLIKTRHKDLVDVEQLNPETIVQDGTGYIQIKNHNNEWYNMNIWDVDESKGLILLEDPIKYNMKIDYMVDSTSWIPLKKTNMNPLKNDYKCFYHIWLSKQGDLFYSSPDSKFLLYPYGSANQTATVRTTDYSHIFTIKTISKAYKMIDIRTRGGEVLNKDETQNDIKSHTTFGYWGNEPTQLNTVLIEIPDVVLETMINQFNEKCVAPYNFTLPADVTEDVDNIIKYINTFEDENGINLIQSEIIEAIRRYIPLGLSVILTDKNGNELFDTYSNPDKTTYVQGLL